MANLIDEVNSEKMEDYTVEQPTQETPKTEEEAEAEAKKKAEAEAPKTEEDKVEEKKEEAKPAEEETKEEETKEEEAKAETQANQQTQTTKAVTRTLQQNQNLQAAQGEEKKEEEKKEEAPKEAAKPEAAANQEAEEEAAKQAAEAKKKEEEEAARKKAEAEEAAKPAEEDNVEEDNQEAPKEEAPKAAAKKQEEEAPKEEDKKEEEKKASEEEDKVEEKVEEATEEEDKVEEKKEEAKPEEAAKPVEEAKEEEETPKAEEEAPKEEEKKAAEEEAATKAAAAKVEEAPAEEKKAANQEAEEVKLVKTTTLKASITAEIQANTAVTQVDQQGEVKTREIEITDVEDEADNVYNDLYIEGNNKQFNQGESAEEPEVISTFVIDNNFVYHETQNTYDNNSRSGFVENEENTLQFVGLEYVKNQDGLQEQLYIHKYSKTNEQTENNINDDVNRIEYVYAKPSNNEVQDEEDSENFILANLFDEVNSNNVDTSTVSEGFKMPTKVLMNEMESTLEIKSNAKQSMIIDVKNVYDDINMNDFLLKFKKSYIGKNICVSCIYDDDNILCLNKNNQWQKHTENNIAMKYMKVDEKAFFKFVGIHRPCVFILTVND